MSQDEQIQMDLPRYFIIGIVPVKMFLDEENNVRVERISLKTGKFEPDMQHLYEILHGKWDEVEELNEDQFIGAVENLRIERFANHNGTAAPLYALIQGMRKVAADENRPLTEDEKNIIITIKKKTYHLFENSSA